MNLLLQRNMKVLFSLIIAELLKYYKVKKKDRSAPQYTSTQKKLRNILENYSMLGRISQSRTQHTRRKQNISRNIVILSLYFS